MASRAFQQSEDLANSRRERSGQKDSIVLDDIRSEGRTSHFTGDEDVQRSRSVADQLGVVTYNLMERRT